jgi:hypothetical protein
MADPIDYAQLARAHGGTEATTTTPAVDYGALAQQVRDAATTPGKSVDPTVVDSLLDWLPTVGGVIGGVVGQTPGLRMVTAGIGGAAGEGYRQLGKHITEIPGAIVDVARNLVTDPDVRAATLRGAWEGTKEGATQAAIQGGIQAAGQGAGEALVGTAQVAAPWLMNRALNLTAKLSREFPTMSSTMLEHAITVSKGGLEQARALLQAAKTTANAALTKAQATGLTVPITAATNGLRKTLGEVVNSADIEGGLQVLADVERKIGGGRAGALTPVEADALKRSLQTQSKQLYTAAKMGQGKPNVTVRAQALADMAESLNEAIGTLTTNAGAAGYRAANATAQELIGAARGITNAIRPGANLYQAMVRPGVGAVLGGLSGAETGGTKGAVTGTLVGGALTSPAGMSRLAVALARPSVQAMLRQAPKLAAALASLATESQEP